MSWRSCALWPHGVPRINQANRTYKENLLSGGLSEVYAYDWLNQLSGFQRGTLNTNKDGISGAVARSQAWDPDALGNFESVTTDGGDPVSRTHNKQNQLTGVGSNTLTFDANGNMSTDETGRDFGYDAWNRVVSVDSTARYAYDALNRRTAEGDRDLYYTSSWQMIEERESGAAVARYVWSPVFVDALVLRDRDANASGSDGLEERVYVTQDANYNVTGLVSTSGSVLERYKYDPYGAFTKLSSSWGSYSGTDRAWVYLHQGGRWDGVSGLFHFRWRDYSPSLMRWATADPIKYHSGETNFYRYVGDSPPVHVDPTGLYWDVAAFAQWDAFCRDACAKAQTDEDFQREVVRRGLQAHGGFPICYKGVICPCITGVKSPTFNLAPGECPEIDKCIWAHEWGHVLQGHAKCDLVGENHPDYNRPTPANGGKLADP